MPWLQQALEATLRVLDGADATDVAIIRGHPPGLVVDVVQGPVLHCMLALGRATAAVQF